MEELFIKQELSDIEKQQVITNDGVGDIQQKMQGLNDIKNQLEDVETKIKIKVETKVEENKNENIKLIKNLTSDITCIEKNLLREHKETRSDVTKYHFKETKQYEEIKDEIGRLETNLDELVEVLKYKIEKAKSDQLAALQEFKKLWWIRFWVAYGTLCIVILGVNYLIR